VHKFILLILKNLGRSKVRTILTSLAVAVLVTISAEMVTVTSTIQKMVESDASQAKLVVTERWVVPSRVPLRYVPYLNRLAGVTDWTTWSFYFGSFDATRLKQTEGLGLATRVENLTTMHAGLHKLDPAVIEALKREKNGALLGTGIMDMMNWKVGQQFTLISSSHPDKNLTFRIVGVMPIGEWPLNFFFRQDYFEEGIGNKESVNCVWLRTKDAEAAREVAEEIQKVFEKRQPELKVETESAGVARFASRGQAVLSLIRLVVFILVVDMVIVLSNSISVATRERRSEMAVLKVLGFEPGLIMALVVGEATLVGAVSGFAGATAAWSFSALALHGLLQWPGITGLFMMFPIAATTIAWGTLMGALVGFAGSIVPAWNARKVRVSDVFAKIA
jgi:putative ABC transport system permease protein